MARRSPGRGSTSPCGERGPMASGRPSMTSGTTTQSRPVNQSSISFASRSTCAVAPTSAYVGTPRSGAEPQADHRAAAPGAVVLVVVGPKFFIPTQVLHLFVRQSLHVGGSRRIVFRPAARL